MRYSMQQHCSSYSDVKSVHFLREQINAGMFFEGECVPGAGGEGCAAEETPIVETPVGGNKSLDR